MTARPDRSPTGTRWRPSMKTLKQARKFFEENYDRIREAFYADHVGPTGGLLNPRVVGVEGGDLEIRCHYNNYDNDEDAWTWFLDPANLTFYN
jgi:hypothetical protein